MLAKGLRNGLTLRDCFPFEVDWLVRRSVNSLPRKTSHQLGKLWRIFLGVLNLFSKGVTSSRITDVPYPTLEVGDFRVSRICCPAAVTLTDESNRLRWKVRSEGSEASRRDVAL